MKQKAYFIGGEFDLTIRMIDRADEVIKMFEPIRLERFNHASAEPNNEELRILYYEHQIKTRGGVHIYELVTTNPL
jgi:hypothetical protein